MKLARILLLLASSTARADTSLAAGCRESRHDWSKAVYHSAEEKDFGYATSAWISRLKLRRDLDGDGVVDVLDAESADSYRWSSRKVTLVLGKRRFTAGTNVDFHQMSSFTRVPPELVANARARAIVEEVLFPRVCPGPEVVLRRLLDDSGPLEWRPGQHAAPRSYAVYSTRPQDRELAKRDDYQDDDDAPHGDTGAVWLFFDADELGPKPHGFHMMLPPARKVGSGARHLIVLPHAVVLAEPGRHAWVYVAPTGNSRLPDGAGGQLPRAAAITSARLDDNVVIIERADDEQVRVDLTTGKTTSRPRPHADE